MRNYYEITLHLSKGKRYIRLIHNDAYADLDLAKMKDYFITDFENRK